MKRAIQISNRELRAMKANAARSAAINQFMAQCEQDAKDVKEKMFFWCGFMGFLCLVFLSAAMGLK